MIRFLMPPLALLVSAVSQAAELTVEKRRFFAAHHFEAKVVAETYEAIWEEKEQGEVMFVAPQGKVEAGAVLVIFEKEGQPAERKAEEAGWWFHGEPHGQPAAKKKPVGTFLPGTTVLLLSAKVPEVTARRLAKDLKGEGNFAGDASVPFGLKVAAVGDVPEADGLWPLTLAAEWPESVRTVPGATVETRFVTDRKDEAIALPAKALAFGPDGWTVEVKLADGKTEARKVQPGLMAGDLVEIVSGLEPGQVIVVP